MNVVALCAGYGGLELGLRGVWPEARTVCYVEREAYAAAVLVAQMGRGGLDTAPVWSDLDTFEGGPWRGYVDCVTAGFPCQPHSLAGSRKGTGDERWLWPAVMRIVRDVGAWLVVLENVPGLATSGLDRVLGALAESGFAAEWGCLRASEVGAPHRRERLFVVAADAERLLVRSEQGRRQPGWPGTAVAEYHGAQGAFADADRSGLQERRRIAGDDGAELEAAVGDGRWWRQNEAPEPTVRGVDDGTTNRVDRLRLLGNGVVPQQATEAIRQLWTRLLEG